MGEELALDATIGELIGVVERRGPESHYVIADFQATVDANATPVAGDDAAARVGSAQPTRLVEPC